MPGALNDEKLIGLAFGETTHALKIRPEWLQRILAGTRINNNISGIVTRPVSHDCLQVRKRPSFGRSHAQCISRGTRSA